MKKLFKKLFSGSEKKFLSMPGQNYNTGSYGSVTPDRALNYYELVAPINTAVNMVADEASSMDLVVKDSKSEELIFHHPILDLLKAPNADVVQEEFLKQLAIFFQVTGNAFVLATGPVNRPPLELFAVNPASVELVRGTDGFTKEIKVHATEGKITTYKRQEVNGRFRYFDGADNEIWHMKSYHPGYGRGELWGLSQLAPISVEIEQYIEASVHNLSLLKRGARPSGAVKVTEMLTDDQYQRLQHQLERFYSGSANAGRSMILEGGDFVQMSQTNKDMDFATLKAEITKTIYSSLDIPLALVTTEATTFNNMTTAQLMFYDNAVLPLIDRVLNELTAFIMLRYDKTGTLSLFYEIDKIEALEPRRNEELQKLQKAGVLTINEMRMRMGFEALDGGDTVYIASNLMPLESGDLGTSKEDIEKLLADQPGGN